MPETEIKTRPSAAPAHPGLRLLALVYDTLPMIPLLMLGSAFFLWANGGRTVEGQPVVAAVEFIVLWSLVGLYFVLSWHRGGQTMGMRPWRLQVLASDGRPAGLKALWLRYLVATATVGLGQLWCLVDADRRSLADLASATDRKSTRLNSSHSRRSRMPSSA